ncbi:MAG: HAD family hydrolase [Syntrophothermus sp.]
MNENEFAVIFDMDGVLIDNAEYHEISWKVFFKRRGIELSNKEFKETVFGRTGRDALKLMFKDVTEHQIKEYAAEVNTIYREEYAPFIKEVPGLTQFLSHLKHNKIKAALATSAPSVNVEYVMDTLNIKEYFTSIVDDTMVTKGKPDPEVYLLSAKALNREPSKCVVFEDSISGIQSARNAGMKVVGVATTHKPAELNNVDKTIENFINLTAADIISLYK